MYIIHASTSRTQGTLDSFELKIMNKIIKIFLIIIIFFICANLYLNKKNIYSIKINIIGNIDGEAQIILYLDDGRIYNNKEIKGKIDLNFNNDWYSNKCKIEYKPNNVNNGKIIIYYEFFSL